jgi:hypothetical protein
MGANVFVLSDRTFSYMSSVRKEMLSPHLDLQLPMQLVHIITKVVSSNFICYTCTFVSLSIIPGGATGKLHMCVV